LLSKPHRQNFTQFRQERITGDAGNFVMEGDVAPFERLRVALCCEIPVKRGTQRGSVLGLGVSSGVPSGVSGKCNFEEAAGKSTGSGRVASVARA